VLAVGYEKYETVKERRMEGERERERGRVGRARQGMLGREESIPFLDEALLSWTILTLSTLHKNKH
jgi:hypothetical protein